MAKYSIIIPVYNVASFLRECLDSLRHQTITDWEAVCVDDGSTDGSSQILDEYAHLDTRFRVVHQPNAGVSAARNTALAAATGEWLYFLDADDIVVTDGFEKLDALTHGDNFDAFFLGGPIYFSGKPPKAAKGAGRHLMTITTPTTGKPLLLTGQLWGWPWIRLLRRTLFSSTRFPLNVANLEDSISLFDILAVNARWCWTDWQIYGYRSRMSSACHKMTVEKVLAIIPCFTQMYTDARTKLNCTHKEAITVLRQYSCHLHAYVAPVLTRAPIAEIKKIALAYAQHVDATHFRTANIFLHLYFRYSVQHRSKSSILKILLYASYWQDRLRTATVTRLRRYGLAKSYC